MCTFNKLSNYKPEITTVQLSYWQHGVRVIEMLPFSTVQVIALTVQLKYWKVCHFLNWKYLHYFIFSLRWLIGAILVTGGGGGGGGGGEFEDIIRHSVENHPDILLEVRKNMPEEKTGPGKLWSSQRFTKMEHWEKYLENCGAKAWQRFVKPTKKCVRIYSPYKSNTRQPIPTENRETPSTEQTKSMLWEL